MHRQIYTHLKTKRGEFLLVSKFSHMTLLGFLAKLGDIAVGKIQWH